MSSPLLTIELKEKDFELHKQAGLIFVGTNEDGETEWLGNDAEWDKYEKLVEEYFNN